MKMFNFNKRGIIDYSYVDTEKDCFDKVPYQAVIELKSKDENPLLLLNSVIMLQE